MNTFGPFTTNVNPELISVSPTLTTSFQLTTVSAGGNTGTVSGSAIVVVSTAPPGQSVQLPIAGMPASICSGTVATPSVNAVNNAMLYNWEAPAGSYFNNDPANTSPFVTTTPAVQITFGNPAGSFYSVSVQAANGCGSSLKKVQKVRGTVSVPSGITGVTTACENTTSTYSIAPVSGALSYQWSITGDATFTGNGNTISVDFGPAWNNGNLCVAAQTGCYTSPSKCISIGKNINALSSPVGSAKVCPNTSEIYSITPASGVLAYNWTYPVGTTGSSSGPSALVNFPSTYNGSGKVCVSAMSICGIATSIKCKSISTAIPSMPASISGALTGVCNQTVNYTCPVQTAATSYNWTAPAGATIASNGNSAVSISYNTFTSGNVCVAVANTCGVSLQRCITVKGAPAKATAITTLPASWCAPSQGIQLLANTGNITGSYNLKWNIIPTTSATFLTGQGNPSLFVDWHLAGNFSVQLTSSNACGNSTLTKNITVASCRLTEQNIVSTKENFSIYPNPASTLLTVQYYADENGSMMLSIKDVQGRTVSCKQFNIAAGINRFHLDISHFSKGIYFIESILNEETFKSSVN